MGTKVLGAVGLNGSGKDTVLEIISKKIGCPLISIGDIVRDIAKKEKIKPTRENLVKISKQRISRYGKEYFPRLVAERIRKISSKVVCVTGIRTVYDVRVLREEFGDDFVLLSVETSPHVRFERLKKRGQTRDPKGYDEFLKQEENEEKVFNLSTTMKLASHVIPNDESLDKLEANVQSFLQKIHLL